MEEQSEMSASGTITCITKEVVSDSNTTSHENSKKRKRPESNRFKGVVEQPNGHWGAQIYANDRIWLGTFKSQVEAAMAYDSAAIRLRRGDAHRNFPWTSISIEEPGFQSQFSTEALLGMIKEGSYLTRFTEHLRKQSQFHQVASSVNMHLGLAPKKLFEKELTPSDVGKLNRLVIPKKYAMMHFPRVSKAILESEGSGLEDEEMEFVDSSMRARWKFRYCYWKSSQSFVFTRGWNRFVKEKRLRAKDTIVFSLVEFKDAGSSEIRSMLMIDVGHQGDDSEKKCARDGDFQGFMEQSKALPKPSLRLFGVQIV